MVKNLEDLKNEHKKHIADLKKTYSDNITDLNHRKDGSETRA